MKYAYHTIYYIYIHFLINKIMYSIKQKYFVKYIFSIIKSLKKKKHVLNILCIIFVQKYYIYVSMYVCLLYFNLKIPHLCMDES